MSRNPDSLNRLLAPAVESLGYELVGVEYQGGGKSGLLRIYVDKPGGITLDDCQKVSHQVSGLLDVEDPIRGKYTLEVSSPGLDRPLFNAADFARFAGRQVKVRLLMAMDGRKNFIGELKGLRDGQVLISQDGKEIVFPVEQIDKARLVPDI